MPRSPASRSSRGLSLMETILAAAILSLVLMVLFNLYPSALLMTRRAEHRLQASLLAQSLLETERSRPFTQLLTMLPASVACSNRPAGLPPPMPESAPVRQADGVVMTPEIRVDVAPDAPAADAGKPLRVVLVEVKVRWTEAWVQDASSNRRVSDQVVTHSLYVCDVKR